MKNYILTIICSVICSLAVGQNAWFVDGYHGGIYGHYPVNWKTQFLMDQLAEHPDWRICLEIETETWDTVRLRTPLVYAGFQKMAADRRIEFVSPAYAQPYCYNVSGESIIRQFEYGMRDIHRHFPGVEITTYSVEEPCFTSSLPQILKGFGFKYAVLKCPNTCWGGYTRAYGGELVNWIGPDGTSILTVPRYGCEEFGENSTWQTTAWNNSEKYLDACFAYGIEHPVGMCFQDAGWNHGPWLDSGDRTRNSSIYVTWREYFEEVSEGVTDDDYRMSQEDVLVNLMWGSQVLQRIARQVHRAENMVVQAEKMGVLANLTSGYRYSQDNLDEAWRTVMLAQHHDSWIVPYNRLNKERSWAGEIELWTDKTNLISEGVIAESALATFADGTANQATRSGYIRVFNTLGNPRSGITSAALPAEYNGFEVTVRGADGKKIDARTETEGGNVKLTFKADVPAFGFATYHIEANKAAKTKPAKPFKPGAGDYVAENDMYRIVFDRTRGGIIKSLVAKKEGGKEYVDSTSEYCLGELRGHFYNEGRFRSSTEEHARITIVKNDGFETVLLIEGTISSHPFSQTVTLRQGQRNIDFDLTIDWKENVGIGEYAQAREESWAANRRAWSDDRFKLNVLFPVALDSPQLYKDAPFDVCESQLESTAFNRWDDIKHNVILNWVSLAEKNDGHGFALFTDHTTSYSYAPDFPLALTLQYSGYGLWSRDYNITCPLNVKYAIVPHSGTWDTASVSDENIRWNEPLIAAYGGNAPMESCSLVDLEGTGYRISAARLNGNGILLRLYNAEGDGTPQKIRFGFGVASVDEVTLAGDVIEHKKLTEDNTAISVEMPRFGFRTFIINR